MRRKKKRRVWKEGDPYTLKSSNPVFKRSLEAKEKIRKENLLEKKVSYYHLFVMLPFVCFIYILQRFILMFIPSKYKEKRSKVKESFEVIAKIFKGPAFNKKFSSIFLEMIKLYKFYRTHGTIVPKLKNKYK